MTNWTATIERYLAEGRTVSGGKGDDTIKEQEQQQEAFNNQLQVAFRQQFGNQSNILSFLNGKLTNQINSPTGFTPAQMAALNTANTEGSANAFSKAEQATNNAVAARGGSTLPSGVNAQLTAENARAAAAQEASGNEAIQTANAERQQQNYWNAVNAESGVAAQENPTGFGALYNSGSGTIANLADVSSKVNQNPIMSILGGGAGGASSGAAQTAMMAAMA